MNHAEAKAFSQFDRAVPEPREIDEQAVIDRANILQLEGERHDPFNADNFVEALDAFFVRNPAKARAMMQLIKFGSRALSLEMRDISIEYNKAEALDTAQRQLESGE